MNRFTPSTSEILTVYERLLAARNYRHWWPVEFGTSEEAGFEIAAGAILVQNTSWSNAHRALSNLHSEGLWGYREIHQAPVERLVEAIRSSGYYNTKTNKLKAYAEVLVIEFEGKDELLFDLPLSELRTKLLSIYGIGEETADDIILYAAKKPSFVMDTYTRRIVDRLGWTVDGNKYSDYQQLFEAKLEPDVELWGELHAQFDGHAARVCKKSNPECSNCVLLYMCQFGQKQQSKV